MDLRPSARWSSRAIYGLAGLLMFGVLGREVALYRPLSMMSCRTDRKNRYRNMSECGINIFYRYLYCIITMVATESQRGLD